MPDENRVFDISKPGSTNAHPAGKPVIIGHHPAASDPMVRTDSSSSAAAPSHILVQDSSHKEDRVDIEKPAEHSDGTNSAIFAPVTAASQPVVPEPVHPTFGDEPGSHQDSFHDELPADQADHVDASADSDDAASDNPDKGAPSSYSSTTDPQMPQGHLGHVEGIHLPPRKHGRKGAKILMIVVLLAVAGYLFIDSNVVDTGINLPFHIFKQKAKPDTAATSPPPAPAPQAQVPEIPTGFSHYKITGTTVTFAAPTAWGAPTSTTDKGFTTRSSSAQPDSNYAYLVDFPDNKNVELAVTSAKYLPPARTTLYYDFLQWCTGSSDGKYYFSVLKFSTTNKVDTPSTITCDQGPLTGATKLDDSTLVQTGLKDEAGKPIGDLYTKNLTNKDLPVLRVKDTAASSADDIKKMLNTVKEQS